MKTIILILLISIAALGGQAQTRVVVRTPCKRVVLHRAAAFRPAPILVIRPAARIAVTTRTVMVRRF